LQTSLIFNFALFDGCLCLRKSCFAIALVHSDNRVATFDIGATGGADRNNAAVGLSGETHDASRRCLAINRNRTLYKFC
jgi:hypothetical protein